MVTLPQIDRNDIQMSKPSQGREGLIDFMNRNNSVDIMPNGRSRLGGAQNFASIEIKPIEQQSTLKPIEKQVTADISDKEMLF